MYTEEITKKFMYSFYIFIQQRMLCNSTSLCAFSMAAYRPDQKQEYGVRNWKIVKAAVL